jgi:glutamyl-tRNA reductase
VRFVNRVFEDLSDKTALLIGAGEVGELTLTYLREAGIGRVIVVSRSIERAREVADRFNGDAVPFDLMLDYLPAADVVISQTAAEGRILERKHFKKSQRKRDFGSTFVLDLAVPRDVAEDITDVDGVYLYNVDDLEHVVAEHAMERSRELENCTAIIREESERFMLGFPTSALGPLISEIRNKAGKIREYELERVLARLSDLPPELKDEIATFAERLTNKLLHPQIRGLKEEATKGNEESVQRLADALGVDKEVNLPKLRREKAKKESS